MSARPGMERNAQDNHLPGEVQLSAGPSVEDAGAVGVLRDADIVVPGGQDGKYVHMGAHFPSVFQNQVEDIVLLFMLEKAPRKDGDGVPYSTIELLPVSRQMGFEPITTRFYYRSNRLLRIGAAFTVTYLRYIFFIGRNRGFVNSPARAIATFPAYSRPAVAPRHLPGPALSCQ